MKRTLAFLLSLVMLFSLAMPFSVMAEETEAIAETTVATTEFSDVPSDSPYKEAISTLTGLGIILGDAGSSTFRPEAGITRAEFCVIVARLKNLGALNVPAETVFTDVTTALCDEWKVKAVRIASDLGIVSGMGDGTFAPDAPVTYEQSVKMLVCLLKYEPMAKGLGGWPAGYIAAGAQIGLTKKAVSASTEPAPRQIIAQLVYNALDIPEMSTTVGGVASGESTTILDGTLKTKEATGIVTATGSISLTANNTAVKSGQVQIDNNRIYYIGSSGADKYFGKEIKFYYTEDDGDYTIQSCKPTIANKEFTFKPNEIKHLGQNEIEIYRDEDYKDYDTYSIDSEVILMYNNYTASYVETSTGYLDSTYKPYDGSLKLIDNDSNNIFDIIIIEDAKPFVVSAVKSTTTESILYNAYNPEESLDLTESANKVISIKKNGADVTFSSLTKETVMLVAKSLNPVGKQHINIEVVSNTKTGTITSMNTGDRIATIASKDYEITEICWKNCETKFKKGSTVTVYLDSQDRIVYIKLNSTATESLKYGYLIYAGAEGQGLEESKITVRLYTQDGVVKNYSLASKVQIDGDTKENENDVIEALKFDPTVKSTINKDAGAELTEYSQFIKYTLNARGEINKILTAVPSSSTTTTAENLVIGAGTTTAEYKSSTKMLGTHYIGSSTKIFFVPSKRSSSDDYTVGTLAGGIPANQTKYTFETYDIEDGTPKVLILFGDTSIEETNYSAPLVVVTKIQEISTEDGDAHRFTAYYKGSEKTYTTEDLNVLAGVQIGDVIKLKVSKTNIVTKVLKMYSPENANLKLQFPYNDASGDKRFAATEDNDITKAKDKIDWLDLRFCMMCGTVSKKYDDSFDIVLADVVESGDSTSLDQTNPIRIPLSSSVVYYKYSVSDGKLTLGSEGDLLSYEATMSGASKVLVLQSYGTTTLVLVVTP